MADFPQDDQAIIAAAYAQRVRDLFKIFAEGIYTGEPEREAGVRFRRGLISARRVYELALAAIREGAPAEIQPANRPPTSPGSG